MIQKAWKNELKDLEQKLAAYPGCGGISAMRVWSDSKERADLVKTLLWASSTDSLFVFFPDSEIFWDCAKYQKKIFGGGGLLKFEIKIIRGAQEVMLNANDFSEQVFTLGWAQKCEANIELLADIRNNIQRAFSPLFANPSFDHVTLQSWNSAKANPEPRTKLRECLQSIDWEIFQLEQAAPNHPSPPSTPLRI